MCRSREKHLRLLSISLTVLLTTALAGPVEAGLRDKAARLVTEFLEAIVSISFGQNAERQIDRLLGLDHVAQLEAVRDELRAEMANASAVDRLVFQQDIEFVETQIASLNRLLADVPSADDLSRTQAEVTELASNLRQGLAHNASRVGALEVDLDALEARLERIEIRFVPDLRRRLVTIRVTPFRGGGRQVPAELVAAAAEAMAAALAADGRVQIVESGSADVVIDGSLDSLIVSDYRYRGYGTNTLTIRYILRGSVSSRHGARDQNFTKNTYTVEKKEFFPLGDGSASTGMANAYDALDAFAVQAASEILAFVFWDPLAEESAAG